MIIFLLSKMLLRMTIIILGINTAGKLRKTLNNRLSLKICAP